ncbi:MAG: hypothetical protein IT458_12500 [Planctomycetes bacterium]|nr:hypothetical protein [Planctomycetota bacterium]
MRRVLSTSALAVCATLCAAQDYLVVGPPALAEAAQGLLQARRAEGLRAEWIEVPAGDDPRAVAEALRTMLHARIAAAAQPGHVLLLGDAARGGLPVPALARPGLPTIVPGMPGSAQVWSDLGYVDVKGDGAPSFALGRIPAASPDQLRAVIARSLAYERLAPGEWVRELTFCAGDGDFGAVLDATLENAMRVLFTEELDPAQRLRSLVALPESPYFAPPEDFAEVVRAELDAGPFAFLYAGHGQIDRLADLRLRGRSGSWPLLRREDAARLRGAQRTLVFAFACHVGEFPRRSLGEDLLFAAHGPVAVVAASQVSFPFGDLLLGRELMRLARDHQRPARLGPLLAEARRRMLAPDPGDPFTRRAQTLAGMLMLFTESQARLRRYTADLYHLLGDPALRLPRVERVAVEALGGLRVSAPVRVRVTSPRDAQVVLELARDRGRPAAAAATRPLAERRAAALDDVLFAARLTLRAGVPADVDLGACPSGLGGHAVLRVHGTTPEACLLGGVRCRVRLPD